MQIKVGWAREFFEGEGSVLSMSRLLCFMSFFPASWVTVKLENENALTIYVATYALSYLGSKGLDVMNKIKPNLMNAATKGEKSNAAVA